MKTISLNAVRLFTDSDVYHYTVENRPLQDMIANDQIIVAELERQSSFTTADVGDANITVGASGRATVFYNSPLTNGRAVTLNTTDPEDGDLVRVVRTANATGASTLTIQAAGATSTVLAAGQWADYEFWGSGGGVWMKAASGAL